MLGREEARLITTANYTPDISPYLRLHQHHGRTYNIHTQHTHKAHTHYR